METNNYQDDIEKAVVFIYIVLNTYYNDIYKKNPDFNFQNKKKVVDSLNHYDYFLKLIYKIRMRFQDVLITNLDFRDCIRKFDNETTFFYLDPPYIVKEKYYSLEFTEKDHLDLFELLKNTKSKFLLSYSENEFIENLYKDFYIQKIEYKSYLNKGKEKVYHELLIRNYDDIIQVENYTLF